MRVCVGSLGQVEVKGIGVGFFHEDLMHFIFWILFLAATVCRGGRCIHVPHDNVCSGWDRLLCLFLRGQEVSGEFV